VKQVKVQTRAVTPLGDESGGGCAEGGSVGVAAMGEEREHGELGGALAFGQIGDARDLVGAEDEGGEVPSGSDRIRPPSPASDTSVGSHDQHDDEAAVPLLGGNVIAEPTPGLVAVDSELHLKDYGEPWLAVRATKDDHGIGMRVGHGDRKGGLRDFCGQAARDAKATAAEQRCRQRGARSKELDEDRVFARGHCGALNCTGDA
jgi:hypothetical protein